jgi:hypothetical protein
MNIPNTIYEEVKQLPEPLAQEVLRFIRSLKEKPTENIEINNLEYQQAKERTLKRMYQGYHLGGEMPTRNTLYER